jgi:phage gp29-like protein
VGFFSWFKATLSPSRVSSQAPVVREKPLWEQFQRIGGGISPLDVSFIMQEADSGQPARLIDLGNEGREKDGHFQSVAGTRDRAVALCDLAFVEAPHDARLKDKKAEEFCYRILDEFENWPLLIEHLTSSWYPGHATAELVWKKTKDGFLIPYKAKPIPQRDFIFTRDKGELRYARHMGDMIGADILADNPGRIIQVQRRIVGDVPVREGLIRILVWAALLRNWTLRDWVALGEIGWKPWRLGTYEPGTQQDDIDALTRAMERIGSTGVGVFPKNTEAKIEWPKGIAAGTAGSSTHRELFDALAREMSKAVLGQTTSVEPGPNGDRASTQTRDLIRLDIRESDAISVAAALRAHLFGPAIALNMSDGALVPVPWFQTDEATDQLKFAQAVEKLVGAGCRIPAKWVRDEVGMPEPLEGEELLEPPKPPEANDDDGDDKPEENDDAKAA